MVLTQIICLTLEQLHLTNELLSKHIGSEIDFSPTHWHEHIWMASFFHEPIPDGCKAEFRPWTDETDFLTFVTGVLHEWLTEKFIFSMTNVTLTEKFIFSNAELTASRTFLRTLSSRRMNLWLHEPSENLYLLCCQTAWFVHWTIEQICFILTMNVSSHWTVLTIESGLNYSLSNNWPWIELPL